jgi:hypothetical protein
MLHKTVVSPAIFSNIPKNHAASKAVYNNIISLLMDLSENCVILVDQDKSLQKLLIDSINSLQGNFKKRAKVALQNLQKNNRLIEVSKSYSFDFVCEREDCKHCIGISLSYAPNATFMTETCCQCIKSQNIKFKPTDSNEYAVCTFNEKRRINKSIALTNGEWNQEQFENEILIPIFKYAKHIKIYDRMIGRTIREDGRGVREHYRTTLEWLFKLFLDNSLRRTGRRFEVYSGLDVQYLKSDAILETKNVLENFASQLSSKYNFKFNLTLKQESGRDQEMTHARYLATDQIKLLIERGYDLLWTDNQMKENQLRPQYDPRPIRDVAICWIPELKNIEKEMRRLPDL